MNGYPDPENKPSGIGFPPEETGTNGFPGPGSFPEPQEQTAAPERDAVDSVYEWLEVFAVSVAVVMLIFTFFFRIAVVDGSSMTDTLHDKDLLIISNLGYTPKQGDIVVFQNTESSDKVPIIKRVIALEGQTVNIDFDTWQVTVDGIPLKESEYVRMDYLYGVLQKMREGNVSFPHVVSEGCVFCMGDNRNGSSDSRVSSIGDVDVRFILGHALFRVFPLDQMRAFIPAPETFDRLRDAA